MNAPIEFEARRLPLRQWKAADREPFAALNSDPIVAKYFLAPLTREQSDTVAERRERFIAAHGWGEWATELKATGEFIGFVGLNIPQEELPLSPCVEISWRLAKAHWHQGFATEAARGALRIGFEVLQLPDIVAFTVPTNIAASMYGRRL